MTRAVFAGLPGYSIFLRHVFLFHPLLLGIKTRKRKDKKSRLRENVERLKKPQRFGSDFSDEENEESEKPALDKNAPESIYSYVLERLGMSCFPLFHLRVPKFHQYMYKDIALKRPHPLRLLSMAQSGAPCNDCHSLPSRHLCVK